MLSGFLGKQIIRQNLRYCAALIIVLAATMLATAYLILSVKDVGEELNVYSPLKSKKGVYCSINADEVPVSELKDVYSVEYANDILINLADGKKVRAISGTKLISGIVLPLSEGRWFCYDDNKKECEVVITEDSGYKTGDTLTIVKGGIYKEARVAGLLPAETAVPKFHGFGNAGFSDLTEYRTPDTESTLDYDRYPLMICADYLFDEKPLSGFSLVVFDNSVSDEVYAENIGIIKNTAGFSKTIETLFDESRAVRKQRMAEYVPVIAMLSLLDAFVLAAVIGISLENGKSAIAVTYASGGSYKTVLEAYVIFAFFVTLCATALYAAALAPLVKIVFEGKRRIYDAAATGLSVPVITAALFIGSAALVLQAQSKKKIAEIIKQRSR